VFDSDCFPSRLNISPHSGASNLNLRAQRDLLLPKLISGEIDLSEAARLREAAE
jgi:type I restriction enzyme S subunit